MLAALVLELGHAAEFAVRHVALHDPAEFGVLTNVGLHEQGADLGVEAHGHEHLGESDRAVRTAARSSWRIGDRMEIDHTEEGVGLVLHLCPVPSGAEEVAEVLLARGLDAGEDAGHGPTAYGLTTAARVVCHLPSAALYAARVRSRANAVDDRFRVGVAEHDTGGGEVEWGGSRRFVNGRGVEAGEFGHPTADVVAACVELSALAPRVEDPEVRGSQVRPGDPLPVASVLGRFGVGEQVPEVAFAAASRSEIFHEERCSDHTDPVVHPARLGELAHAGIDDWEAGADFGPCRELLVGGWAGLPRDAVVLGPDRPPIDVGELMGDVGVPVAPGQLANEALAAGRVVPNASASDRGTAVPKRRAVESRLVPSTAGRSRVSS